MKYTNIILIISTIPIIAAIILFHIKFISKYNFKDFMITLESKYDRRENTDYRVSVDVVSSFREVFGHYHDNGGITIAFYTLLSLSIVIITIIELIFLLIFQLVSCKCRCCCIKCCSFCSPIHCLVNMTIFIYLAFAAKYKVNIEDNILINIFGNEFFKEIKKNLDYMKSRKIILIVCAFVAFIALCVQLAMVMINHINEKKERNNNNNNTKPQITIVTENFQKDNLNTTEILNNNNAKINTI